MADNESLKMATLKKAYAEIILNTSKEAAARILVADRKAMSFEKVLLDVKQDALRMLVLLKKTLDSKTSEAEVRSANQEMKIEVLEAQLSEAEGIIVDLREELRLTQDKLEKLACSQNQPLKRHTSEDYEDQQLISKNELIAETDDRSYHMVQHPSTGAECRTENPAEAALPCAFRDQLVRHGQEQPSTSFQLSILSHCDAPLDTYDGVKSGKERCSSCSSESDEKDAKRTFNGSEAKSLEYESCYDQAMWDGFGRTRKNVKYQEVIAALGTSRGRRAKSCQLPSSPQCRSYIGKQDEAFAEVPDKNGVCPMPGSYCVTSTSEINYNHGNEQEKSNEFQDKSRSREKEGNATEKGSDMRSDIDPPKFNQSLADSSLHDVQVSEESEGIYNRADSDKVLKFTFYRKRKKEMLTKLDNNVTPEVSNIMNKAQLEQGHAVKLQKSNVNDEHTKDSRQLLQVAHQLVPLSANAPS